MVEWRMDVEHKTKIMRIKGPELILLVAKHIHLSPYPGKSWEYFLWKTRQASEKRPSDIDL